MATRLETASLYGNDINVYRFELSGMTLYTIHTKSLLVKGYFVSHGKTLTS